MATMGWTARRAYVLMLFGTVIWLVLGAEQLMETFGIYEGAFEGVPCSDIVDALSAMGFRPSFLLMWFMHGVRHVRRWCSSESRGAQVEAALFFPEVVVVPLLFFVVCNVVGHIFADLLPNGVVV